jgi:hypothetical protein
LIRSSAHQGEQGPVSAPKIHHLAPHIVVLTICLLILLGSFLLKPSESGDGLLYIGSLPLPHSCTFKNLTGIPCPGCGLSHSMVEAARGDLKQSFRYHHLGLLTLIYVLAQLIYRIGAIAAPELTVRILGPEKYINSGLVVLAVFFLLNWIFLRLF